MLTADEFRAKLVQAQDASVCRIVHIEQRSNAQKDWYSPACYAARCSCGWLSAWQNNAEQANRAGFEHSKAPRLTIHHPAKMMYGYCSCGLWNSGNKACSIEANLDAIERVKATIQTDYERHVAEVHTQTAETGFIPARKPATLAPKEHRVQTVGRGIDFQRRYKSICSCGWEGMIYSSRTLADDNGAMHLDSQQDLVAYQNQQRHTITIAGRSNFTMYRAICSCGWSGILHEIREHAEFAGSSHVVQKSRP